MFTRRRGAACPKDRPYTEDSRYKKGAVCCRKSPAGKARNECPNMTRIADAAECPPPRFVVKSPFPVSDAVCCRKTRPKAPMNRANAQRRLDKSANKTAARSPSPRSPQSPRSPLPATPTTPSPGGSPLPSPSLSPLSPLGSTSPMTPTGSASPSSSAWVPVRRTPSPTAAWIAGASADSPTRLSTLPWDDSPSVPVTPTTEYMDQDQDEDAAPDYNFTNEELDKILADMEGTGPAKDEDAELQALRAIMEEEEASEEAKDEDAELQALRAIMEEEEASEEAKDEEGAADGDAEASEAPGAPADYGLNDAELQEILDGMDAPLDEDAEADEDVLAAGRGAIAAADQAMADAGMGGDDVTDEQMTGIAGALGDAPEPSPGPSATFTQMLESVPVGGVQYSRVTLDDFLRRHCGFLSRMIQLTPAARVKAIDILATRSASSVLAVAREFLLAVSPDLPAAARTFWRYVNSSEDVFAAAPSRRTTSLLTPRMLLFFVATLRSAAAAAGLSDAAGLEAYWVEQATAETPLRRMMVLFGVAYMVFLADQMKTSRVRDAPGDAELARRRVQQWLQRDVPRVCANSSAGSVGIESV
jgi:hypothetical protein